MPEIIKVKPKITAQDIMNALAGMPQGAKDNIQASLKESDGEKLEKLRLELREILDE